MLYTFASDNTSGAHPRILEILSEANPGSLPSYGEDVWTNRAITAFKTMFGNDVDVWLVPQGTGANVLALRAMCRPWQSVLLADVGHPVTAEASAVEAISGCRLALLPSKNGKVLPENVVSACRGAQAHAPHATAPGVLALTQSTEVGTVYTPDELRALCAEAKRQQLPVFMDGARFANAAATLGGDVRGLTRDLGIDVMTFGGTKNGLVFGEAILIFNPVFARDFGTQRKQALQLMSKQRFLGAQFVPYLEENLWLDMATHANAMARRLAEGIAAMPHLHLAWPVEANGVFLNMQPAHIAAIQQAYEVHEVDETAHTVRFMCAFDTTPAEVDALLTALRALAA